MNAWRKQSINACVAYSLWFIGAIDDEALQEYEAQVNDRPIDSITGYQRQWAANYAPWLSLNPLVSPTHHLLAEDVEKVQLGVAIVRWPWAAHAVAIINGMILDPDGEGKPQTPTEYLEQNDWPIFTAISEKP